MEDSYPLSPTPRRVLLLGIFLGVMIQDTQPQNLNSRPNVESLLHMEGELIDFCQYVLTEEVRLHKGQDVHGFSDMNKFLRDVEPISSAALSAASAVTDDILQIMVLKRRLTTQWGPFLERIHESEFVKRVPITKRKIESIQYIINKECNLKKTVITDIFRLQHYYKLPTDGLSTRLPVSNVLVEDVARVVSAANDLGDHATALNWIKFGLKVSNASADLSIKKYFLSLKAATFLTMSNYKKAEKIYAYLAKSDASSRTADSNLKYVRNKLKETPKAMPPATNFTNDYNMQLCRGNVQPSESERPLRCYTMEVEELEQQVRVEEIHHHPRIVVLRDFITKAELNHIKDAASKKIMSKLISDLMYKPYTSRVREPRRTHWTRKYFSTLMNVTYQGSNVRRDEIFDKVVIENEGPGGLEVPTVHQHWQMYTVADTLPVANFILFMNDVISGGGIAFPDLHLKVEPEEGSMLFWQFKTQKGPVHPHLRRYVKCPVVKGNQWVARTRVEHHGIIRHINL